MRARMRLVGAAATAAAVASALVGAAPQVAAAASADTEYTVLAARGVSNANAIAAIKRAGGVVVSSNTDIGLYRVRGPANGFVSRTAATRELVGAAHRIPIGKAPSAKPMDIEREAIDAALAAAAAGAKPAGAAATQGRTAPATAGMDPLDNLLWGLTMVRADQARQVSIGDPRVEVGILDTGIDASHPDIAPNFSWALSRNFAPDVPEVDGPCEVASCVDPVGTDDNGHGTHTAGTVGAAINGLGVSGVAPGVTLVELKGGQDSGFFFLEPVVNALTYAANAGIDVVNMSFFVDPWLYNCVANPADSPQAQLEQRVIIAAMSLALTYAHLRGVTLINSLGNNHEDKGHPRTDFSSPDFPLGSAYPRDIDNDTCFTMPVEGPFVLGVSALGPSTTKADYSDYGLERISVSAPGGWFRDGFGTPTFRTNGNQILSTYPLKALQEAGLADENGNITPAGEGLAFKDCDAAGQCGYYVYLQGTSMAAPHAVGVAALIVSRFGNNDPFHHGKLRLEPWKTEIALFSTAAEHPCPDPPLQSYQREGRPAEFDALCEGGLEFNGFYGFGIVDAYAAVTKPVYFGAGHQAR